MSIGDKVKALRKQHRFSQQELAEQLNVHQTAVSQWETGRTVPDHDAVVKIAKLFNVSTDYILENETRNNFSEFTPQITEDVVSFPIIGEVAAGYDHLPAEIDGERIDIPSQWLRGRPASDYFVLRITGDSMYPLYMNGDLVLVLRQSSCDHSGDIAVVIYDDEAASIKRVDYVMGQDWMKLTPVNPNFPPIKIEGEALEHCRVLGLPKMVIREIES